MFTSEAFMASNTVALVLDGAPNIRDYVAALQGLRDLLDAISAEVAEGVHIEWVIDQLEGGSATTVLRGEAPDLAAVQRASEAFLDLGIRWQRDGSHAIDARYLAPLNTLERVLNDRIPSMRLETADNDVTISREWVAANADAVPKASEPQQSLGAIEGRVQTLSNRGSLRFTLYDLIFDKGVSCYLSEGQEGQIMDAWGKLAVVEGMIKRDSVTGRPLSVRHITRIQLRPEHDGGWRSAQGALKAYSGDEPAELTIRRIRDAQ
jgi:hypothetical protein